MKTRLSVFCAFVLGTACAGVFGPAVRVPGVDAKRAMGVALDGKILYCIAGPSVYALDVASPLAPKVIGRLDGMDQPRQIAVADGFAYVVSRETGLRIVDVRDPKEMKLRSRYDSVEFATGLDVVGKTVFLSERIYGVEAVDVSDPDRPRHLAIRKTGESQSNRYRNGYLYSGEWGAGRVTVFDAHDMADFREIGTLALGGFGDGLEIAGNLLYCSTGHDARHHRADALRKGPSEPEGDGLASPLSKDARLVGAGRGMDIFDLSDPAKPRHVSRIDFPVFRPRNEDFWTVRVADGYAFCCDSHNGLFAVDVRDPANPEVVDRFLLPSPKSDFPSGAISSCAVGEGCVYVTSFPGGLVVLPVNGVHPPKCEKGTPPAHPHAAERYATDEKAFYVYRPAAAGQARTACLKGDLVYAAFGDAGLHVLRLDAARGFEMLGELPGGHRVTDCCFVGDRLVTAEGLDGWALYELDGPAAFREIARRATRGGGVPAAAGNGNPKVTFQGTPNFRGGEDAPAPGAAPASVSAAGTASVAFWCWPAGERHVLLTPRCAPYCVVSLDDFANPKPLCRIGGTCQWDKYPPDGMLGTRLPILNPYSGLMWLDFADGVPKAAEREARGSVSGSQGNGLCRFGERYLYTVDGKYRFVTSDDARTPLKDLPNRFTGIPRSDGRFVVLTNRSGHRVAVYDFKDPENPVVLRAYTLAGNPDCAAIWKGRAVIPAGHQGLLMERCER